MKMKHMVGKVVFSYKHQYLKTDDVSVKSNKGGFIPSAGGIVSVYLISTCTEVSVCIFLCFQFTLWNLDMIFQGIPQPFQLIEDRIQCGRIQIK